MTEIKSCVSCKHSVRYPLEFYYCKKFGKTYINYVTGKIIEDLESSNCYTLRQFDGECGPGAIGWEAPEEKTFSQKVWEWLSSSRYSF